MRPQMRYESTYVRDWLGATCGFERSAGVDLLQRQKRDALKTAIRCVDELVGDAGWMQRHDPERQLDKIQLLLSQVAETALVVMPLDSEKAIPHFRCPREPDPDAGSK
jgi:hypothetical protein